MSRAESIRRHLDTASATDADDLAADLAAIHDSFGVHEGDIDPAHWEPGDREVHR